MLYTNENAKNHWCPEARYPEDTPAGYTTSNNRTVCLGTACAMFRWYDSPKGPIVRSTRCPSEDAIRPATGDPLDWRVPSLRRGYCGKAGKPEHES